MKKKTPKEKKIGNLFPLQKTCAGKKNFLFETKGAFHIEISKFLRESFCISPSCDRTRTLLSFKIHHNKYMDDYLFSNDGSA